MNKFIENFIAQYATHPRYYAPRGNVLHAGSWQTEAPLRLLLNNLDKEVAEDPANLIVYGGTGRAARSIEALRHIVKRLLLLRDDESLLIQSGKAVGILPSHEQAPRVLIANSNLVPQWATWEHFNALQERGLIMFGQMTAGSWIYIGTQGILQGTFETFSAVAQRHFHGSLRGKVVVSGGLGGMGGAQPLAVTLNEGIFLGVDIDIARIEKRLQSGYLDRIASTYLEAIQWIKEAKEKKISLSIGLEADISTTLLQLIADGFIPDIVTDQTSAHDPINGYVPAGFTVESARLLRKSSPQHYKELSLATIARHVEAIIAMKNRGAIAFEYGNNLREFARQGGASQAFSIPGFIPEYIRPLFCTGRGPFRWVALSGEPKDIAVTDAALIELFPEDKLLHKWLRAAQEKVQYQGLPARICWLGLGEREKAGKLFNELVRSGAVTAPIAIGRDHLDSGSVASPYRETENMLDGSDAISDWPLLNLMANCAAGATWISFHHGGGVGMGYSQHAGMVVVADGSDRAERCLSRVLHSDPALGVLRHADAGYPTAVQCAIDHGLVR